MLPEEALDLFRRQHGLAATFQLRDQLTPPTRRRVARHPEVETVTPRVRRHRAVAPKPEQHERGGRRIRNDRSHVPLFSTGAPVMQLQVLFSRRESEALMVDGILHSGSEPGAPATIVGERNEGGLLDVVIPATLEDWAEDNVVVDLRDTGTSLELSHGDTRVLIRHVDVRT